MPNSEKLKSFVENYTDANGDNPIAAAFSLWTIAKSVPLQAFKAGIISFLIFALTIVLAWYSGVPWIIFLLLLIFGGIGFIVMTFFGTVKFLSGIVLDAIADVLTGLLAPIDDMYDVYKESEEENLSRVQFSKMALQEVVLPRVSGVLEFVPMKKSVSKSLSLFVDNVAKKEKEEEEGITAEDIKGSSIKSTMVKINQSAKSTNKVIGKPFSMLLFFYVLVWVGIVIWYFVGG